MKLKNLLPLLFLLSIFHFSLFATDPLPPLVKSGEPFTNRADYYISNQSGVNSVAFSPDGKTIVSGSSDGSIKIWDTSTGKELKSLEGHTDDVNSVAFSPNGKTIVSGSDDRSIKIWDASTGKMLKKLEGHTDSVNSVVFSPNGKTIVSGSDDRSIKIWDVSTGKELKSLEGHKGTVNSVAFSPNGKNIVSGSDDYSIKIWDVSTGKELKSLEGHTSFVNSVAFSPNGKTIVSGSRDKSIKIWDVSTGKELKSLEGHTDSVNSVAFSPNGKTIVSGSDDRSIKIWDVSTGKELKSLEGHKSTVNSVAFSPNGKTIVSGSYDYSIKIWDASTGKVLKSLEGHKRLVSSVAFSPNGKTIVSGSEDGSIKIWDASTGKELKSLEGHTGYVLSVAFSPDGKTIVSGSFDNSIKIWDASTGKELKSLEGHKSSVNSVAFSPNGKTIVSGSGQLFDNGSLKIWDVSTGKELKSLEGHTDAVSSVTFSPNGKTIVSGSGQLFGRESIKIWDVSTGKELKSLEGHTDSVNSVAFSPNGKTIVSGSDDYSIKIWDASTGKELKSLEGHTDAVSSVTFSPNGKTIVSGSDDRSIKIWDASTGKELKSLERHTYYVHSVAFSPNGKNIISGSWDGTIKYWSLDEDEWQKESVAGRGGNWIVFDNSKKTFLRGDDGTLLYEKNGSNLKLALPKLPTKDFVELLNNKKSISTINEQVYPYDLTVKNSAEERLYWLKTEYHDPYCTLLEQRLSNLEAKEEQNMTLNFNCSLPRENPKPIENHQINLIFETATKSQFRLPLSVSIRYAQIDITKAEISEDGKNLNVEVKNIGNETLVESKVNLSKPFQADIQSLTNLEANATKVLAFAIPKDTHLTEDDLVSLNIYIPNQKSKNAVPLYEWQRDNVTIVLNKMAWYIYALWFLAIGVLLVVVWYYRQHKHPLVLKLAQKPKTLLTLNTTQLKEAKRKLKIINRWESTLQLAKTTQELVDRALEFYASPSVEYFAKRVNARNDKKIGDFDKLTLSNQIGLNINNFLLYLSTKNAEEIKEQCLTGDKIFVITKEEHQDEVAQIAQDKSNNLIAPTNKELTQLLLHKEPQTILVNILAKSLSFEYLSPYQTKQGVESESNFFGRIEIIRDIINKSYSSYFLVGARQLGKSSILKALKRRYEKSATVDCYMFDIGHGDMIRVLNEQLKISKESSLDDIVTHIGEKKKKSIFFIDEADVFIEQEKQSGYAITKAFRKLSQEGNALFVIAGFWTLYHSLIINYQSPLKNFGEIIYLEGLEDEACRELMIKPMQRIGVSYENEEIITTLIKRCGNRANLIAIICDNLLKKLDGNIITQKEIEQGIDEKFKESISILELTQNKREHRIDRVIVYMTIKKEQFTLSDVIKLIKEENIHIVIEEIEESLLRLVLGYIIQKSNSTYSYTIPLFKEIVLEDEEGMDSSLSGVLCELRVDKTI